MGGIGSTRGRWRQSKARGHGVQMCRRAGGECVVKDGGVSVWCGGGGECVGCGVWGGVQMHEWAGWLGVGGGRFAGGVMEK